MANKAGEGTAHMNPIERSARLLAVTAASVLMLGALTAAAPRSSGATIFTYLLNSSSASVKVNGRTWGVQVLVNGGSAGPASVTLNITTAIHGGKEVHGWSFQPVPGRDLTVKRSAGVASVKTHSDLSPIAALSLSFAAASHHKEACAFGAGTVLTGTLKGSVTLATGLKGLKISRRSLSFGRSNTLTVGQACVPPTPCVLSAWAGPLEVATGAIHAAGGAAGRPGHLTYFVSVFRTLVLNMIGPSHTVGVQRGDTALMKSAAPKFSNGSLTVTSSKSGLVTGSAMLSHGTVETIPDTCTLLGIKYAETTTDYVSTSFASPHGDQFEAHTLLTGTLKVDSSGIGQFSMVKLTKKSSTLELKTLPPAG
jgi:hypothetical protein